MNFTRITNIGQIKNNLEIAISSAPLDINITDTTTNIKFTVIKHNNLGELFYFATNDTPVIITQNILDTFYIYKIEDSNNIDSNELLKRLNEIQYNFCQLRNLYFKTEKNAKKYKAMLKKRFGATEEEIDRNFNNVPKEKKDNEFVKYKKASDIITIFYNKEKVKLPCCIYFSCDNNGVIKCDLHVQKDNYMRNELLKVTTYSKCHEEDTFNLEAGEMIAYNKAYSKALCLLH